MSTELRQLEILAEVDGLMTRLRDWMSADVGCEPQRYAQAVVSRLLQRVQTLRVRLEAPLVVATFGGTGTGKSALVNALLGHEATASGRQRPTTTLPIVVAHPTCDLDTLNLPLGDVHVVRSESPLVRDMVLIDCPDPDTSEGESPGSNLQRLHRLLPYCDVLLIASTQQKYRSGKVVNELAQAATGCRLVFVQTCAEIDTDIRDDWRRTLSGQYEVPEMFFVDSIKALREQQAGQPVSGEFAQLRDLLSTQLAAGHRTRIRRANLLDLVFEVLTHLQARFQKVQPAITQLEKALDDQRSRLVVAMSNRLQAELLASRQLWERRALSAVVERWGLSPFSFVLRLYSGLGSLLASASFFRARTSAQMALIGAMQGARWLTSKSEELEAENRLERVTTLGLDDQLLRESQLVIAGFARDAEIDPARVNSTRIDTLRTEAARVESQFLGDASRQIDDLILTVSRRQAGPVVRVVFEVLLLLMLTYVVGWPAYNFFYLHPFMGRELISSDFYIHGGVFLAIWAAILVIMLTGRLRRGLQREIQQLAEKLAHNRISTGLFPELEATCLAVRDQQRTLETLQAATQSLRRDVAGETPRLGSSRMQSSAAASERMDAAVVAAINRKFEPEQQTADPVA